MIIPSTEFNIAVGDTGIYLDVGPESEGFPLVKRPCQVAKVHGDRKCDLVVTYFPSKDDPSVRQGYQAVALVPKYGVEFHEGSEDDIEGRSKWTLTDLVWEEEE